MRPLPHRLLCALTLAASSLASPLLLADDAHYNQVSLRAEVNQEVAHDLMHVTLYTEAQNSDPAKLAAEITRTLNATLEQARQAKGVDVELGSRSSYPVYDDKGQKITQWRERAEIRLQSADFVRLSSLTGELLQKMKMGEMQFSIASTTRKSHEDALLKDAVDAFKARAQLATEALGGSGYKLVSLNLNSGGFQQRPVPMRAMAKGMSSLAESAPTPQIEAGTSQVTMSADGVIEVQMP